MRLLADLVRSMRPRHWVKNTIVFVPLIFAHQLFSADLVLRSLLAFAGFCLLASAAYLVNDLVDCDEDRRHPEKCRRPIAAGRVPVLAAAGLAVGCALLGLAPVLLLGTLYGLAGVGYLVLMFTYSFWLRRVVVLDVLTIAAGFVLRAVGGAAALPVDVSVWLLVCAFLLALLLALGKRRAELRAAEPEPAARSVLGSYAPLLLDQLIAVAAAAAVVAYVVYTVAPDTYARAHTGKLVYTVPFVIYGVFRYLFLVYRRAEGSQPERLLIGDWPLLAGVLLWAVVSGLVLYL